MRIAHFKPTWKQFSRNYPSDPENNKGPSRHRDTGAVGNGGLGEEEVVSCILWHFFKEMCVVGFIISTNYY